MHATTAGDAKRRLQLKIVVVELPAEALHRGVLSSITVEFNVQDGIIRHIRRKVERTVRQWAATTTTADGPF
jgi:hypothetical protein